MAIGSCMSVLATGARGAVASLPRRGGVAPAAPSRLFRGAAAPHQDPVGVENADVVDLKSPARRCRRETLQSMPSPRQQYEFRGGFGGRAASSAAPTIRRRGGEAQQTSSAHLMLPGGPCTQSDEDLMTIGSCMSVLATGARGAVASLPRHGGVAPRPQEPGAAVPPGDAQGLAYRRDRRRGGRP